MNTYTDELGYLNDFIATCLTTNDEVLIPGEEEFEAHLKAIADIDEIIRSRKGLDHQIEHENDREYNRHQEELGKQKLEEQKNDLEEKKLKLEEAKQADDLLVATDKELHRHEEEVEKQKLEQLKFDFERSKFEFEKQKYYEEHILDERKETHRHREEMWKVRYETISKITETFGKAAVACFTGLILADGVNKIIHAEDTQVLSKMGSELLVKGLSLFSRNA